MIAAFPVSQLRVTVATQASLGRGVGRELAENPDELRVALLGVRFSWSVTGFAALGRTPPLEVGSAVNR